MIQRIQSIFLLLASVGFFLFFVFPFASSSKPMENFFSDKIFNIQDHVALMIIAIIGGVLALVNVFLFKNRPLQIRIGYMIISLGIILPILAAILMLNEGEPVNIGTDVNDQAGLYLPLLIILFGGLAIRFIKKDNKLVKSMDRLR